MDIPAAEERILAFWKEIDVFRRQLELTKDKPRWTFYEGPPFATGTPHYGHILASVTKDIFPRFWAASGHYVERRWGWDCHGIPLEHIASKELAVSGRAEIERFGIGKYNEACRAIVLRYAAEWKKTVDRMARWTDMDNAYTTMGKDYMETVVWVFKQLWDKGQIYQSFRVMPYSTSLCTPLSNAEAKENYQDTVDPAVVVSFPLVDDPNTCMLAWTTTPWTLPSNLALAVHPDFEYVKVLDQKSGHHYILLEKLLSTVYGTKPAKDAFKVVDKIPAAKLIGLEYSPLFDFFTEEYKGVAFRVLGAKYVSEAGGVGIVHQAPAYGEDDFNSAVAAGIVSNERRPPDPLDEAGRFLPSFGPFSGMHVKEADKHVIKHLKANGRLVSEKQFSHSYPFCPRSDTPLIYRAVPSWFIRVDTIKDQMLQNIKDTHFVPASVGSGRFASWVAEARDWNVSRNRYWGTPMMIWTNGDETVCVGSVEELRRLSGYTGEIPDLHRHNIDHITIPSQKGGPELKRVSEILDCWFDSGCMPYASIHYPYENVDVFEKSFPASFVSEGLDQTRGWFYSLLVLGTHLLGKSPFRACVTNGIILAEDGRKMSKKLKNYPAPEIIINKYGSDALRIYLINSPVVKAEPLRFKESGVKEVVQSVLLPMINAHSFFEQQAAMWKKTEGHGFMWNPQSQTANTNVLDKWILASTQSLLSFVHREMRAYRLDTVTPKLLELLEDVTNIFIRCSRRRLKGLEGKEACERGLQSLFEVLFTLIVAMGPFTPFLSETIYQRLRDYIPPELRSSADDRSVHFLPYPTVREELLDHKVERAVGRMKTVLNLTRTVRHPSLKQKLGSLVVLHPDPEWLDDVGPLSDLLKAELNVDKIILTTDDTNVQYSLQADWPVLGKKLRGDIKKVKAALPAVTSDAVKHFIRTGEIQVAGITLGSGDLVVRRSLPTNEESKNLAINTDNDAIIIIDNEIHPHFIKDSLVREVISRIQKLRKKVGLQTTDEVGMSFFVKEDPADVGLEEAIREGDAAFREALRGPLVGEEGSASPGDKLLLGSQDEEIQGAVVRLRLLRL